MTRRESDSSVTTNSTPSFFGIGFVATIGALCWFLLYVAPARAFVLFYLGTTPVLHWAKGVRSRERVLWAISGLAASVAYALIHRLEAAEWMRGLVVGLSLSSVFVSSLPVFTADSGARRDALLDCLVIGSMPLLLVVGMVSLTFGGSTGPTFDSTLAAVDHTLFVDPSFAIGRALRSSAALSRAAQFFYDALPLAVAVLGAAVWRRRGAAQARAIFLALGLSGVVALLCFSFLPAAGPVYEWGDRFPLMPPGPASLSPGQGELAIEGFRNALPSIHMVAALVIVFAALSLTIGWRFFAGVTCLVTVVVTLGTGQHYFIDLVAAVPLAVAAYAASQHGWRVRRIVALNLIVLAMLLTALRFFAPALVNHPEATWAGIAAAVSWGAFRFFRFGVQPTQRVFVQAGTRLSEQA